jgi:hypothetical protein
VIVQPDLAHRPESRVLFERFAHELRGLARPRVFVCLVRVHAGREPGPVPQRRQPFAARGLSRIAGREDRERVREPRLTRARDHLCEVRLEHRVGEMTVGVDHGNGECRMQSTMSPRRR